MEVGFLFYIFEELREIQKIKSRETLVRGVIDISSYNDYRNKIAIKSSVIEGLLKNLKLSIKDLYDFVARKNHLTIFILGEYHHAIMTNNHIEITESVNKLSDFPKLEGDEKKYFDFLSLLHQYEYAHKINRTNFELSLMQIINYPNCFSPGIVPFLDLNILYEIGHCKKGKERLKITDFLIEQFNYRQTLQHTESSEHVLLLLHMIVNLLGCSCDYEKASKFATFAISFCLNRNVYYFLEYFYFERALCYKYLNDTVKCDSDVIDCYQVLKIKKDSTELSKFLSLFDDEFQISHIEQNNVLFKKEDTQSQKLLINAKKGFTD